MHHLHHRTTRREKARVEYNYNRTSKTRALKRWTKEQTTPTREEQDRREQGYTRTKGPELERCATSPSHKGWHPQVLMVPVSKPMLPPPLTPIRQVADRPTETHTQDRPALDQAQEEHVAQEVPDHQGPDLDHQTTRDKKA